MNKATWVLGLLLASLSTASAQTTATFTYGPVSSGTCSTITSWTFGGETYEQGSFYVLPNGAESLINTGNFCYGQADPESGVSNFYSYLTIPFQFGFENNGYWAGMGPTTDGSQVCNPNVGTGKCTTEGDQYTITYSANGPEGGSYTATTNWKVHFNSYTYHGVKHYYRADVVLGGSGTATE